MPLLMRMGVAQSDSASLCDVIIDSRFMSLAALRKPDAERTQPPPKEKLLENFSGLKENFPGRWWIQKPYKNPAKPYPPPKSFLCGPHFFSKESSALEQGGVCFLFPSDGIT